MKCSRCNGKGEYFNEVYNDGKRRREILVECDMCHGTGEVQMTNEEWFCSLSTTEKAEFLSTMAKKAESISWWDDWLKEKHESEGSDVSVR